MKFSRLFLNCLQNQPDPHDTVVVIDVLHSFITGTWPNLPLTAHADLFAFAMPVAREDGVLVIR